MSRWGKGRHILFARLAPRAERNPVDSLPELIVEVLSPSTSRKDRVTKLNHCQWLQVAHYWIINPDDGVIEAYALRSGDYMSVVRACDGTFTHIAFRDCHLM